MKLSRSGDIFEDDLTRWFVSYKNLSVWEPKSLRDSLSSEASLRPQINFEDKEIAVDFQKRCFFFVFGGITRPLLDHIWPVVKASGSVLRGQDYFGNKRK